MFHLREYRGLQKQLQWGWEDPKSDLGGNTIKHWRGDLNSCGGRYLVDVISMYFNYHIFALFFYNETGSVH